MGLWVGTNLRKQSISTQLPRRNPGQEVSRQSWLVAILNFLTSPFPFEHQCPTEIREITHCYNFLGRWVCLSWDQDRHTQKPLTGIGAKLFDGAERNFAGSRAAGGGGQAFRSRLWRRSGRFSLNININMTILLAPGTDCTRTISIPEVRGSQGEVKGDGRKYVVAVAVHTVPHCHTLLLLSPASTTQW